MERRGGQVKGWGLVAGEHAAREELGELLLDEPGQAAAAAVRDFSEEGLRVLALLRRRPAGQRGTR